jgi:hypothetical protein
MGEPQMKEIKNVKNLMNDEELMSYVTEDLEDFEEDTPVTYEVWAIGYTEDNCVTDADKFLGEFNDPDEAIAHAKKFTMADLIHLTEGEDESEEPIAYVSVEVETVVADEEEGTMNVGTIYKKELWINEEEEQVEDPTPVIELQENDYALVEDGMLKVGCTLLKDFNKNDYVKIKFVNENTTYPFTYKIVSKVEYEDGNYFHCEFIY